MRISDVVSMAGEYLKLGIFVAVFVIFVFVLGYGIVYRRILHKTEKLPWKKVSILAVTACYIVVVLCATLLNRGGFWETARVELQPFVSYRAAWNSFSLREWRNLILNICMFVPFGLLLPLCGRIWQKFYWTYLTGFAFTLMIELVQLLSKRGIFELDDIYNNLLGTMIGYGGYRLLHFICCRAQRERLSRVLPAQLPLVWTAAFFGIIFTAYELQEFGNLSEAYSSKIDMSGADLQLTAELSQEADTAPVYQMHVANEQEVHALAQELFAKLGTQIDESQNDIYDETAVYYNAEREMTIWVDYAGSVVDFTDFREFGEDAEETDGKTGCKREEIEEALGKFGIHIAADAVFKERGDGNYAFEADYIEGDALYRGILSCTYHENGKVASYHNGIICYQEYRQAEILSEQEAYEQIRQGKFRIWDTQVITDIISMEIRRVQLSYAADSKGFYQPVYEFAGTVNGAETTIMIPAMK